jgi:hypothetical protein
MPFIADDPHPATNTAPGANNTHARSARPWLNRRRGPFLFPDNTIVDIIFPLYHKTCAP